MLVKKLHKNYDCATNPCAFNATCTDLINDFQCSCPEGFEGKRCEKKVDICQIHPCHHGSCVDSLFSRRCICDPGWGGESCDININECQDNPCKNNGLCIDLINDFECQCLPGYYGSICQYKINYCSGEVCQNDGICVSGNDSFICKCPNGYDGIRCENNIDECKESRCNPEGTLKCKDGINKYECICKKSFIGKYCDERIDECQRNPCYNGGVCYYNDNNEVKCKCGRGWKGDYCQEEVNMCSVLSNPCQNNGECIPLPDESFYCSCPDGVTGPKCEILPNLCLGEQCLNGGTCINNGTSSHCVCLPSFTGDGCQYIIDRCDEDYCKNDGECIIEQNDAFKCKCRPGFTGERCETNIDNCYNNNCPEGARCVDQINSYECLCPYNKTGLACDKLVDVDYDLKFLDGMEMAQATLSVPVKYSGNGLSISLWVKFDYGPKGGGSILTLYNSENPNYDKNSREILRITDKGCFVKLFKDDEEIILRFPQNQMINDGNWNHIAFIWNGYDNNGRYSLIWNSIRIVQDGGNGQNSFLDSNLWIKLGSNSDDDNKFVGSITRVNLWNRVINFDTEIPSIVKDCQGAEDIFDGLLIRFTGYNKIKGKVERSSKSTCGRRVLKNRENVISLNFEENIIVKNCPQDILVTTNSRYVNVTWNEPIFESSSGLEIKTIEKNLRPGQVFIPGDYMVLYVGHDENNNVGECHFHIYVSSNHCSSPEDPINGIQACEQWGPNNQYKACSITCHDGYEFPIEVPSFYSCSAEGLWRPNINQHNFKYPNCAKSHNANRVVRIYVNFPNNGLCNNAAKNALAEKVFQKLQYLNTKWKICNEKLIDSDDISCSHLNVTIECIKNINNRVRRDDNVPSQMFNVTIEMGVKRDSETSQNIKIIDLLHSEILLDDIFNFNQVIPNGIPDLNSLRIDNVYHCQFGTVLKDDVCVPCAPGMAYNIKKNICEYCPIGSYQSREGELSCILCPDKTTTIGYGSVTPDECKPSCEEGHYFNIQTSICEECGVGMYQPEKGKFNCYACGVGQTTLLSNSTSSDDCRDECPDGEQMTIIGICQPCPQGSYRTKGQHRQCQLCPEGTTTESHHSINKTQCNLPKCMPGQYLYLDERKCKLCPRGTFQDDVQQIKCKLCPNDHTTASQGATHESQCYSTNQCDTGENDCSWHALCKDLPDDGDVPSYECTCKPGYRGNGTLCIDACTNYCLNDGICKKNIQGFVECVCKENFSGERCEIRFQPKQQKLFIITVSIVAVVIIFIIIIVIFWMNNYRFNRIKHFNDKDKTSFKNDLALNSNFVYGTSNLQPTLNVGLEMKSTLGGNGVLTRPIGYYYEDDEEYSETSVVKNENKHIEIRHERFSQVSQELKSTDQGTLQQDH